MNAEDKYTLIAVAALIGSISADMLLTKVFGVPNFDVFKAAWAGYASAGWASYKTIMKRLKEASR